MPEHDDAAELSLGENWLFFTGIAAGVLIFYSAGYIGVRKIYESPESLFRKQSALESIREGYIVDHNRLKTVVQFNQDKRLDRVLHGFFYPAGALDTCLTNSEYRIEIPKRRITGCVYR